MLEISASVSLLDYECECRTLTEFCRTLQRILLFVEAQQDGNKFKNFFRKTELARLLEDCHIRLAHASEIFKVRLL
jgi:hypothetical protein